LSSLHTALKNKPWAGILTSKRSFSFRFWISFNLFSLGAKRYAELNCNNFKTLDNLNTYGHKIPSDISPKRQIGDMPLLPRYYATQEAKFLQDWAVVLWGLNTLYIALIEEPGLNHRFGDQYVEYSKNVARWVPRMTPWFPTRWSDRL
jgi:hypothetical protein